VFNVSNSLEKDHSHDDIYPIRDGTSFRILEEVLNSPKITLGTFMSLV
jgi:hypothetical protein